jgi:hypothetical protein
MPKTDAGFNPEEYTTVAERVALFYRRYPTGRINTRLLSYENRRVVVEASVYRWESSSNPAATGMASEHEGDGEINAVACLENTETSAVGRALANLGITGSVRRPSREEMEKAARGLHSCSAREPYVPSPATPPSDAPVAGEDVLRELRIWLRRRAGYLRRGGPGTSDWDPYGADVPTPPL